MGSHASPDLYMDFCRKNPRSAELKYTFCEVEFRQKKSAEILGPNIESAEVHCTKPEDEFRPGMGLNTKFRGQKNSRSQVLVRNLCSGVSLKTNLH